MQFLKDLDKDALNIVGSEKNTFKRRIGSVKYVSGKQRTFTTKKVGEKIPVTNKLLWQPAVHAINTFTTTLHGQKRKAI